MGADVVVGFGGYVAMPAYLAVRRRGVPLVIHEANARPGLANRVGARFAAAIAVATPVPSLPRAVHIGMPLRQSDQRAGPRRRARPAARRAWGFDDRPMLFVFGGSQGARRLNEAVGRRRGAAGRAAACRSCTRPASTTTTTWSRAEGRRCADGYVAVPYVDDMDLGLRRRGPGAVPRRRDDGRRGDRRRAARRSSCRCRSATASSGSTPSRSSSAGGGLLVADDRLTPDVVADTALPLLTDQATAGRDGARPRRALGAPDDAGVVPRRDGA